MMNYLKIILIILITNSCISIDKEIDKKKSSESNELKITTTVDKYSQSKGWFYGKIEIENKTEKNIQFNFNQNLKIGGEILKADYNFEPISYANIAFRIAPKSSSSWNVVWRMTKFIPDSMEILILNDLKMMEYKE